MEQDKDPGHKSMLKRVGKKIKDAFEAYTPPCLPEDIDTLLDDIIHQ